MPDLPEAIDPKQAWACRHPEFFPVDVNQADREALLRIPGLGLTSAVRIISSRRFGLLGLKHLEKIGVVMKRARPFIACRDYKPPQAAVKQLIPLKPQSNTSLPRQMDLFDEPVLAIQGRS